MLWEIWGRRKINFATHAAAWVAGAMLARWMHQNTSAIAVGVGQLILVSLFLGSYLDLLTCFGYIETNAQKVHLGYPLGLLLKPVSTVRLVLVPMFFGGSAVVALLWLWSHWVLRPLAPAGALTPLWLGAVNLSFFWWIQALAWGLPLFPGRSLLVLVVSVVHLLAGVLPLMPVPISDHARWLLLLLLVLAAVNLAILGLKWMRQGAWEGGRCRVLSGKSDAAKTSQPRKKFASAFHAQFWLEWQRQGWLLPGLSGGITCLILPLLWVIQKELDPLDQGLAFQPMLGILLVPLLFSGMLGSALARFDRLQPVGPLPVYIAVRPMTNGGFVIAKLAMALASSVLTWMITLGIGCAWLVFLHWGQHLTLPASLTPYEMATGVIGMVPMVLLAILFTWKSLVGGSAAGLTGRRWVVLLYTCWKMGILIGLTALLIALKFHENLMGELLPWLPVFLWFCLILKLAVSTVAFVAGWRRHATTLGAIGWITGGWLAGGLFVAGYGGLICLALHRPELWLRVALGGFLVLPLAELAIAPLALAWNRHR